MAQGDLVVNFAVLRTAAEDIGSTVGTMNGELDGLKQSLQTDRGRVGRRREDGLRRQAGTVGLGRGSTSTPC